MTDLILNSFIPTYFKVKKNSSMMFIMPPMRGETMVYNMHADKY